MCIFNLSGNFFTFYLSLVANDPETDDVTIGHQSFVTTQDPTTAIWFPTDEAYGYEITCATTDCNCNFEKIEMSPAFTFSQGAMAMSVPAEGDFVCL